MKRRGNPSTWKNTFKERKRHWFRFSDWSGLDYEWDFATDALTNGKPVWYTIIPMTHDLQNPLSWRSVLVLLYKSQVLGVSRGKETRTCFLSMRHWWVIRHDEIFMKWLHTLVSESTPIHSWTTKTWPWTPLACYSERNKKETISLPSCGHSYLTPKNRLYTNSSRQAPLPLDN